MSGALCVCMILKNARHLLPDAIDSLAPLAAEISQYVFVDTGSTDGSPDYLRTRLPEAEVLAYAWSDDFAEARNIALAHAQTHWVLFLDADERLASESTSVLQALLIEAPSAEGIVCRRENLDANGTVVSWDELTRVLAVHPGVRFTGRVHERPMFFEPSNSSSDLTRARPLVVQRLPALRLLHRAVSPHIQQEKTRYYLKLIQQERTQWPSPLMTYHWASTLTVQTTTPARERFAQLEDALKETLRFEASVEAYPQGAGHRHLPYAQWAGVPVAACILECQFLLIEMAQRAEMLHFFETYKKEATLAESWGQAALACAFEAQWPLAQQYFYTALDPQYPMADPSQGWGSWRSHLFLATLYERVGDWPAAWAHSEQAAQGELLPDFANALKALQQRLRAYMSLSEAQQVLKQAFQQARKAEDVASLLTLGCFLLSVHTHKPSEEKAFLREWEVPSALYQSPSYRPIYTWFNTLRN
jgi:hypothetical protein